MEVSLKHHRVSSFRVVLYLILVMAMLLSACTPATPDAVAEPAAPAPTEAPKAEAAPAATEAPAAAPTEAPVAEADPMMTIYGTELPAGALPYDQQILTQACSNTATQTAFDFMVTVYQRYCAGDSAFSLSLVDLDKDFNVIGMAAESWEASDDGLTWTFHLRPGMVWSDGTPVTANDWVQTFRYAADPAHAWDFSWFYAGVIKNWDEAIAGEVPLEELGVVAVDDLTLAVTTYSPFPPLPGMMHFAWPLQAKALEAYGPYYNNDPATSVTFGRFKLVSMEPGKKIVMDANPTFVGPNPPFLKQLVFIYMDLSTSFASFQKGEIDQVASEFLNPADLDLVMADPVLKENYFRGFGDFRTDYLMMDTFNPPFNDLNVRKAFAHAVDRESIVKNVMGEVKGSPAYSLLMPGFPSSDVKGDLHQYQNYDCDMAKQYLADAGFPDGAGFAPLELWLRDESAAFQAIFQATAASISSCLNVQIEVSNKDRKVYTEAMNAKPTGLTFGAVSYGMDYLDPTNMLGIFKFGGRHSWKNDEFDALISEATPLVSDPAKRDQMFRDAEKILVDDVGGIFIDHRWAGDLFQPYVMGDGFRVPDSNGIASFHWGNDWVRGTMYIAEH